MISRDDRVAFLERLVAGAREIVSHPRVQQRLPEAQERFLYLQQHGVLIVPVELDDGTMVLQSVADLSESDFCASLKLCPLHPSDAAFGDSYRYFVQRTALAAYGVKNHCVLVNMVADETHRFLGSVFLHELGHALRAAQSGRAFIGGWRTPAERLEEELLMWTFDHELNVAVCGPTYAYRLRELAQKIRERAFQLGETIVPKGDAGNFDFFYGKPLSCRARENREASMGIYAYFAAADAYFPPAQSKHVKLRLLEQVHADRFALEEQLLESRQERT